MTSSRIARKTVAPSACSSCRQFTRRCLAIVVARRLRSDDVLQCLTDLFATHGPPEHLRSDNGPEFVAGSVRDWLGRVSVKTLYIEPGSPWENGYCESLNSKLRDELLHYGAAHQFRMVGALDFGFNQVW
jgi:transposase InsO family protein